MPGRGQALGSARNRASGTRERDHGMSARRAGDDREGKEAMTWPTR